MHSGAICGHSIHGDSRGGEAGTALVHGRRIASWTFRGCPFINLATEFPDRAHPGAAIVCANKQTVRQRFRKLSAAMGARNPIRLGDQLALLMDGAYGQAITLGASDLREELLSAVAQLIDGEVRLSADL